MQGPPASTSILPTCCCITSECKFTCVAANVLHHMVLILTVSVSLCSYSLVPQASCRFYLQQLANANFFVFSSALSYKLTALFANARSCLVSFEITQIDYRVNNAKRACIKSKQ